jgi:hypothetical protein
MMKLEDARKLGLMLFENAGSRRGWRKRVMDILSASAFNCFAMGEIINVFIRAR